ncbi:hypothetical protein N0V93_003868 [Gnomoniopsis smithogilvyi]|uniref:Zn(2)-C6 fungal-type domain-containing protein n=1 Tax=Gnomoniopsis smithogilvyi TaxID=1191159 RepID=A0A9W9D0I1_9PEZI|nr:hypothetical protein N0V93_003868 [Gnomoniopsis smithogilvyi]
MESQFRTLFDDLQPEDTGPSFFPFQCGPSWFDVHNQPLAGGPGHQLQPPSSADSTSFTSDLSDQGLTQGSTLPTVLDEPTSQGPYLSQCEVDSATRKQSCVELKAPIVDLRYIGGGPEIFVNGQVALPPQLPPEDEFRTDLRPMSYAGYLDGDCEPFPGLALGLDGDRVPSTTSSSFDMSHNSPSIMDMYHPSSQSVVRGRRKGLSREVREKAAGVRDVGACARCRIRRVSCDQDWPCQRCVKDFPHHPEFCERRRSLAIIAHQGQGNIWLLSPNGVGWPGQPCGSPVQATVAFDKTLEKESSNLDLALQLYLSELKPYPFPWTDRSHQVSPAAATCGVVPMSTAGNWPGILSQPRSQEYHLASFGPPGRLLMWAERQVLSESRSGGSFEDAINEFIFALRDTPLKEGHNTIKVPSKLVGGVCDLVSWIRIWQAPVIHVYGIDRKFSLPASQQLPETVTWELKSQAATAMVLSERVALSELDDLHRRRNEKEKLAVWACLWQMILIYRKAKAIYVETYRPECHSGKICLAATEKAVEEIHRLLLVKYAAYFGSSSPIYQRSKQQSTWSMIEGDNRLRTAWNNIIHRRTVYYRGIAQSTEPLDVNTKILIVDVEADAERKARQRGAQFYALCS